jgi:hypothetical protein
MAALVDTGIQEDFCIQLDDYPILTKFSTIDEYKTKEFVDTFERLIPGGNYFYFRIELVDGSIKITPLLIRIPSNIIQNYKENPTVFSNYMSLQLKNSGILPTVLELIGLGNQLSVALRVIARPRRDFTQSFYTFHKDQSVFTMLQYYNFDQPVVFGTETLLGYEEGESLLPHELSTSLSSTEKMGNLSNAYKTISAVNSELKAENKTAVVLRGKYNNGDTMIFSDPLIRHATIKTNEPIEGNTMKISIPKKGVISSYNVEQASVRVCSERETTTPDMVNSRQAIAIFMFLDTDDYAKYTADKFGEPFVIMGPAPTKPIKTVNFDKDKFKDFVESLSSGEGCVTIGDLKITSRGGIRRRRKSRKLRVKRNSKKHRKSRR